MEPAVWRALAWLQHRGRFQAAAATFGDGAAARQQSKQDGLHHLAPVETGRQVCIKYRPIEGDDRGGDEHVDGTLLRMLRCGLDAKTGAAHDRLQQHPAQFLLNSADGNKSPEIVELCIKSMPMGMAVTKRAGLEIVKATKHVFGWTEAHGRSVLAEPRFQLQRQRGTLQKVRSDP